MNLVWNTFVSNVFILRKILHNEYDSLFFFGCISLHSCFTSPPFTDGSVSPTSPKSSNRSEGCTVPMRSFHIISLHKTASAWACTCVLRWLSLIVVHLVLPYNSEVKKWTAPESKGMKRSTAVAIVSKGRVETVVAYNSFRILHLHQPNCFVFARL